MIESKLYQILRSFKKTERDKLRKFVSSSYFNNQDDNQILLDYLLECIQLKVPPSTDEAMAKCNAKKPTKFRLITSRLTKLIERFLLSEDLFKDDLECSIRLVSLYRKRNLNKHFIRAHKNAIEMVENQPYRNSDYYQNHSVIERENYEFQSFNRRDTDLDLQKISDHIDINYLCSKLRNACILLSHQKVVNTNYEYGLLEYWLDILESSEYIKIPAIALYYFGYRLYQDPDESSHFENYLHILLEHGDAFPELEYRDAYLLALNHCIGKVNRGDLTYAHRGLELYEEGLKRKVLFDNNKISKFTFDNIVGIGLKAEAYERIEQFIKKHTANLQAKYQESTFHFNMARLHFARKEYDDAILHLRDSDYDDVLNNILSRTLLMKIYYETGESNLLDSHLVSMKAYISRKNFIGKYQKHFMNLVKYTRKLLYLQSNDNAARERLHDDISNEQTIMEKRWLLDKIEDL